MRRAYAVVSIRQANCDESCRGGDEPVVAGLQQFLQAIAIGAAEREFRAVSQPDGVIAVEERRQFLDAIQMDEAGAVDAQKARRIEPAFQMAERFAQQVGFGSGVQRDVIAAGFDPVNVFGK
jgi:hypothetical protein